MSIILEDTANRYLHSYRGNNFHAEIIMNPRDVMVFGEIKSLPETEEEVKEVLTEFLEIFTKKYGAKAVLIVAPELQHKIPENLIKAGEASVHYISRVDIENAIKNVNIKTHIAEQLEKFTGEYSLLTKENLQSQASDLSLFKIKYASFVDNTKIKYGQYSTVAETNKLNNPYVQQYAIKKRDGEIIACLMLVMHAGYAYISDFIIHPDYRNQGIAQTLCAKAYEHFIKDHTNMKGVWLIPGGFGKFDIGAHLLNEVFKTQDVNGNSMLQKQLGLFLMFGQPGEELLKAGNRNPGTYAVNNDEKDDVDAALKLLQQSREPITSATQPLPTQMRPQDNLSTSCTPP